MTNRILDCSDVERQIGKVLASSSLREPISNNDIRRWVHGMHYANLLHFDPDYAAASKWGRIVAPQSFPVAADDSNGATPACAGHIPNSHLLFGGDEWWFENVPVVSGDFIANERIPFDYTVKETSLGPTCFQRGDNFYRNQNGELIAKQRSTGIRYLAEAGTQSVNADEFEEPDWSDEELAALEERKFAWVQELHDLGHGERWWDDVEVGAVLPERVFGPHSVASFTTEWRSFIVSIWGTMNVRKLDMAGLGFVGDMAGYEHDPDMLKINPTLTDGAYYGPSRGHLFPKYARRIGMPRAYGYGASMGAWVIDYVAGWAGEHGRLVHSVANYRGPALTGDVTIQTAEVTGKSIDADGRALVELKHRMTNQKGTAMCTGTATVHLPKRK
ncbi:MaoC family dehydratase N-terminal domain-containing protein [Novosphingobium sp. TH158]|uniref:FAS1-like dehydratase domain-containing protein n=1 Tax=Novosphingobium sp. TH158 TaxID=2067455 RepID=UPI000C7DC6BC|nr:MaoC family dehydratase N-terminal domain-containing protein [Novosphingobium sp. TH158]PLK26717.1 hypothetical protein C0V78_07325 [Novosphingobium sp. TH158]